jgi:hypothetical protein
VGAQRVRIWGNMAEDGSRYGYEYYSSYGSHLSTDTEDAVSQPERSISREPPADAAAAATAGGPPNSRQPSRQPTEDPSLQKLAEAKNSSSEHKDSSDAYGAYTDPADNYPEGAHTSDNAIGSLEPAQDSGQILSQTQSNTRTNASSRSSAADSYYSYYTDDGSGVQPSPSRRGKEGESASKPSVTSGLSSGMGSSGRSLSDGGQSSGAISIGPSVSEPGRATRLRTKSDLARLDQEGLGLAAAGQEQSSYYSDYEYYSDYYAQHAGNQQEAEEYPLVDVAVQLNKPMGNLTLTPTPTLFFPSSQPWVVPPPRLTPLHATSFLQPPPSPPDPHISRSTPPPPHPATPSRRPPKPTSPQPRLDLVRSSAPTLPGIVFEALQPEEEGGIRVVQLMKGSEASERLKLHDVLTGFNPNPNPSPHADPRPHPDPDPNPVPGRWPLTRCSPRSTASPPATCPSRTS